MSKLALRIFVSFFLALIVTVLGAIAVTSWVIAEKKQAAESELLSAAQDAATALAEGGVPSLRKWAQTRMSDRRPDLEILVVDDLGKEILGRQHSTVTTATASSDDDFFGSDLPAVLLNLPTAAPELISDDGEVFRLVVAPKKTGVAVFRDIPLPILLLSLIVTALVSYWLAKSITRPIVDLQKTTESLTAGDLDSRAPESAKSRTDEIGHLAKSLDSMAKQLGALIRGQQQLLRDISHEVRSPLTRIRLASGLLAQRDPSAAGASARIDEEISKLDDLIEKILDVSRLESGAVAWKSEMLDLRAIVERILVDASFEAEQLGKSLTSQLIDKPLVIVADRHWTQSAIENVVRNALKHTPDGASVEAVLDHHDHFARLVVRDSGEGISSEDLARIFQPFYRSTTGSTQRSTAGAGLGLAIAAQVLRGNGGKIEARNRIDAAGHMRGFEICLEWPLADAKITDDRTAGGP